MSEAKDKALRALVDRMSDDIISDAEAQVDEHLKEPLIQVTMAVLKARDPHLYAFVVKMIASGVIHGYKAGFMKTLSATKEAMPELKKIKEDEKAAQAGSQTD